MTNDDEEYEEQQQKDDAEQQQQQQQQLMFDSLENINEHMGHTETDENEPVEEHINKAANNSQGSSTNSPSISSMSSTSEAAHMNNSQPQEIQNNEVLIDLHENRFVFFF